MEKGSLDLVVAIISVVALVVSISGVIAVFKMLGSILDVAREEAKDESRRIIEEFYAESEEKRLRAEAEEFFDGEV